MAVVGREQCSLRSPPFLMHPPLYWRSSFLGRTEDQVVIVRDTQNDALIRETLNRAAEEAREQRLREQDCEDNSGIFEENYKNTTRGPEPPWKRNHLRIL